jgi:predicted nucleotidyltransferase
MRPSEALKRHRDRIRQIALSHRVTDVRVFGSVMTDEDTGDSDLDLLVQPTSETTYFDLGAIQYELSDLLGFNVDVLTPNSLPARLREQVLREAQPL